MALVAGGGLDAGTPSTPSAPPVVGGDAFSFDDTTKRIGEGLMQQGQQLQKEAGDVRKANERDLSNLPDVSKLKPPEAPVIPPAPSPAEANPLKAFGSVASVLGILGGLATKRPLMAGLNASAAAMKAIRSGEIETFKQQYELWKTQSDYAFKLADFQNQQYRDILENSKLTTDQILARVQTRAAAFRDDVTLHMAQSGDMSHLWQHLDARDRMTQELQIANKNIDLQHDRIVEEGFTPEKMAMRSFQQKYPNATPEQWAGFVHTLKATGSTNPQLAVLNAATEQYKATHNGQEMPAGEQAKVIAAMHGTAAEQKEALLEKARQEYRDTHDGQEMPATEQIKLANEIRAGEPESIKDRKDRAEAYKQKLGEENVDIRRAHEKAWENVEAGKATSRDKTLMATEAYRKRFFELKSLDLSDREAHWSAMDAAREQQVSMAQTRVNAMPAVMKADAINQIIKQKELDQGYEMNGEEKLKLINDSTMPDKDKIEQTAKMIANYQLAPLGAYAMRSNFGQAVTAKVNEINPKYDATKFTEKNRAVVAFGTGPQGNAVRSFDVGIAHLAVLDELGQALQNNDIQKFNTIGQYLSSQFGDSTPIGFDAVREIVGQEVTKAVLGAAGTGSERDALQEKFSKANSPAQLSEVSHDLKRLMAGQLDGLRHQYENTTGNRDFDDKLQPASLEAMRSVAGPKTPALAPGGAGWKIEKVN